MRILVLGREGQLAQSLAERAAEFPDLQLAFTSRSDVDLSSSGSAARFIVAAKPDLVINAAAYTAVDRAEEEPALAFRTNGEGAGEAAAAARQVGAAIIHVSTDYVFDGASSSPYDEEAEPNPLNVYGRSKLAGEEAVRAANPHHLILRTAWVYSPFGRNFVKTMVRAAQDRDELSVVSDQHGCPTNALDLAAALLRISRDCEGFGETYHLAGSGSASWSDLASEVMANCKRTGLPAAKIRPITAAEWPTKAVRPASTILDCGKIERTLDIRLPDWRESVAATVERLAAQILA
ncbi:dTDP-4-dehydrorhamnose reductase [Sphingomonas alba]|uniref:dTDP-4-dehydrorhamnose reductase n=1 Tax=Sphingomonas alba TaxID=2908208 RepID=A0ABT0RIL9_9SPHN|nr:dTDP-4-dehydrorhamnose reductase [Sphingomonas alba]MCL6682438.1 dTDP-4-dehydrorhamnose reductase [Sphingomonas alba]